MNHKEAARRMKQDLAESKAGNQEQSIIDRAKLIAKVKKNNSESLNS